MKTFVRVRSVKALHAFNVSIEFTDGRTREIDLEPYLRGPVFESQRNDPKIFRSFLVDPAMGTIVWPNGADIDPNVLYKGLAPCLDGIKGIGCRKDSRALNFRSKTSR